MGGRSRGSRAAVWQETGLVPLGGCPPCAQGWLARCTVGGSRPRAQAQGPGFHPKFVSIIMRHGAPVQLISRPQVVGCKSVHTCILGFIQSASKQRHHDSNHVYGSRATKACMHAF